VGSFSPFMMNFVKEKSEEIRSGKVLLFSAVYSALFGICFDILAELGIVELVVLWGKKT
jgi:hypothetical protein